MLEYIKDVITNMPADWLKLTTHRLDIYNEEKAKSQFLEKLEALYKDGNTHTEALSSLPTAYDYIRLGHPLSCILEWMIADKYELAAEHIISFSSETMPLMAVLRKNSIDNKDTTIYHLGALSAGFNSELIKSIYGYSFEHKQIENVDEIMSNNGSNILVSNQEDSEELKLTSNIDFLVNIYKGLGTILVINENKKHYISAIQHVRRRETIAMTPADCLTALKGMVGIHTSTMQNEEYKANEHIVLNTIKEVTETQTKPLVGSSGLSIQYAIMMGLIHDAMEVHNGKAIKFVVPPNCYGGTNDQARRVAACLENVEIVDLPVDGDNDMVQSINTVLEQIAKDDAIPYIIAEIPTNPRVEVPDLQKLKAALSKERMSANGGKAIDPVFILDQTFCPNVLFLGEGKILSSIRTISYASGSKFPSGGKCTSGYCVGNEKAKGLMEKIEQHLTICNNEATELQMEILAKQLPSMNQRIAGAYENTRSFVNYIQQTLPAAKINFVSEELAQQSFTPSVFSLDLPTKGNTDEERETYKRALNHKLINMMITSIPDESKYCVSYGQLKGCYWTIPATSTQGTTKEGDKDYIARVALSANMDLDKHKEVFKNFVESIG